MEKSSNCILGYGCMEYAAHLLFIASVDFSSYMKVILSLISTCDVTICVNEYSVVLILLTLFMGNI